LDKSICRGQTSTKLPGSSQLPGKRSETFLQGTKTYIQLKTIMNQTQVESISATKTEVSSSGNATMKATSDGATVVSASRNDIAASWYRERSRQAKVSFNVAVGLAGITALLSVAFAVSVCMEKVSEATAAAGLGLTSGAVSMYCFKLSDDANKRLDATAKELLDE